MADDSSPAAPWAARAGAFLIHILTASGAALALVALMLAGLAEWPAMFFVLGIALVVDGIDGPLARRFKVVELLPRWSGDSLDFVVDFVTYVFVPAFAIVNGGLMPALVAVPPGIIIAITGAPYFADPEMKIADKSFRGFPPPWNLAAFLLFVLRLCSC